MCYNVCHVWACLMLLMFSPSESSRYIEFEKETQLSCDEIIQLEINQRGISRLYPDSYFTVEYNDLKYKLIRHRFKKLPELNLAHINQTSFVTIQSFREFEDKKQEAEFPPIYATDEFPEDNWIGTGNMGQVHLVSLGTTPLALKMERMLHGAKQGRTFTLNPSKVCFGTVLVSPLSAEDMPESFLQSFRYWESSKDIHSECIAEIKGLAFIKDLNQWGVLYEYIDGYGFDQFCVDLKRHPHSTKKSKITDISLQLAEALKTLDDAGQAHTDLLQPNILIRKSNHFPVLIDYGGESRKHHNVVESRQQFGKRLTQLTQVLDDNNSDLNQLAIDCQTNKTFDELSWEIILNRLNQIKITSSSSPTRQVLSKQYNILPGFFGLKNQSGDPMELSVGRQFRGYSLSPPASE